MQNAFRPRTGAAPPDWAGQGEPSMSSLAASALVQGLRAAHPAFVESVYRSPAADDRDPEIVLYPIPAVAGQLGCETPNFPI
ncbi:hypothetical protein FBY31_1764 [Arthrobacter sp. SLBN-100]|nr:hypothetical protein FBY31_1764 [Arthrobacter sp. SLBN-100]